MSKLSKNNPIFKNYIFKSIPLAFDESMSYFQTLSGILSYLKDKIVPKINESVENINTLDEEVAKKQDKLTAGANIVINESNVISAIEGGEMATDYTILTNKPSINNKTLSGNLTLEDIGGVSKDSVYNKETIDSKVETLNNSINAEQQARVDSVSGLRTDLTTETNARQVADYELQQNIDKKQNTLTAGANITIENDVISATGGSGGTTDYTQLSNKPKINDVELNGDKTPDDLGLYTQTEINDKLSQVQINIDAKQDLLVSGTNIKTINNLSLLGSGNLDISSTSGGNFVDVKTFGAVGDDETDDTQALQSAINYCKASGYTLFLSHGRYLVTSTLDCTTNATTLFNIIGDDIDQSSIHFTGTGVLFNIQGSPGTICNNTIQGFDIDGSAINGNTCFYDSGLCGLRIEKLKIANFDKVLHIENTSDRTFTEFVQMITCDVTNCNYGMYMSMTGGTTSMNGHAVKDCTFRQIKNNVIYVGTFCFWYDGVADFMHWYENLNPFIYLDASTDTSTNIDARSLVINGNIRFECFYQPEEESSQVAPTIFGGTSGVKKFYFGGTIQGIGGYGKFAPTNLKTGGSLVGDKVVFSDYTDYHAGANYSHKTLQTMQGGGFDGDGSNLFYVNSSDARCCHKVTFNLVGDGYNQYGYFYYSVYGGSVTLSSITNMTPLVNTHSRSISFIYNTATELIYVNDSNSSTKALEFTDVKVYDEGYYFGGN